MLPKGDFILTGEEVVRTLGLTSVVTSGMVESYGGAVGVVVWGKDMVRHATLIVHEGGVEWCTDAKALQALEAMKSFHDFDSVMTLESLALIRKHYNILDEYILHAPRPGNVHITHIPTEEATRRLLGEEGRRVPEVPRKHKTEDSANHKKKDRRKSHLEVGRSAAKGKGPVETTEEAPTPRRKPKSVRELCSASTEVDGRDYHAIQMCSIPECAPDAPLDIDLTPLIHGMRVWLDGEASARYIQGTLIPRLASDLYTLLSEVLLDETTKAMVLLTELRGQLDDSESRLRSTRTQVWEMEIEQLELTWSKDALQADLPKRTIEDYNKSPGFKIGLVRMGRVSLEYRY
ncbi:hypothetical protein BHE74_00030890 [Ensete ventricosum]|nr:hypothetical protein BHE74_00030890 [Ensete ventricosum]